MTLSRHRCHLTVASRSSHGPSCSVSRQRAFLTLRGAYCYRAATGVSGISLTDPQLGLHARKVFMSIGHCSTTCLGVCRDLCFLLGRSPTTRPSVLCYFYPALELLCCCSPAVVFTTGMYVYWANEVIDWLIEWEIWNLRKYCRCSRHLS